MSPAEIEALKTRKALAHERVRAFFDSCVPQHRRSYFKSVAEKYHKDLMDEISSLKVELEKEPDNAAFYEMQCARYEFVSKEVIRKVSFILARSVLI